MPVFTALKIDSVTGDLAIENNQFQYVYDADVIAQKIKSNLKLSKKDWFLNLEEGITYLDNSTGLLGHAGDLNSLQEAEIITAISSVDGVEQILDFQYAISENALKVEARVLSQFGEINIEF